MPLCCSKKTSGPSLLCPSQLISPPSLCHPLPCYGATPPALGSMWALGVYHELGQRLWWTSCHQSSRVLLMHYLSKCHQCPPPPHPDVSSDLSHLCIPWPGPLLGCGSLRPSAKLQCGVKWGWNIYPAQAEACAKAGMGKQATTRAVST